VLCATFLLVAVLAARKWMLEGGARWMIATCVAWFAGLATKEIAAMLPLILFCYDRLILGGDASEQRRRLIRFHLPLFALAAAGAAFRVAVFLIIESRATTLHWTYG